MSQARVVDHVLAQYVADRRITHVDDVEYARRLIGYVVSHALAYMDEHQEPVRWVDSPSQEPCKRL